MVNVSRGAGRFSFLASDYIRWDPEKPRYAYPVSKAARNAAMVLLAKTLERDGIRLNACCPGMVATKLSGMQGKSPDEGAAVVVSVAKLSMDRPTGAFFDQTDPIAW